MQREGGRYLVDVPRGEGATTVSADYRLDTASLFGRAAPLTVEVGSGSGDQIVAAAVANPDINYLALEVWRPGIAKTVSKAAAANVQNLRIIEADAAQAFPHLLRRGSVAEVWTFFPDPWRKARHRKRRLVAGPFAAQVYRALEDGGRWRLATDWEDYAHQISGVLAAASGFAVGDPTGGTADALASSAPRFEGRVLTSFERRALSDGRNVWDFLAVKLPSVGDPR